ncbi:HlyD family secretion protein, partial [Myxococcota bacterium]
RIAARIRAIHVREGDRVQAGQLLVELDCAEPRAVLAQVQAQLAAAEANVEAALAQTRAAAGQTTAAARAIQVTQAEALAAEATQSNVDKEAQRVHSLYESGAIAGAQLDQVQTHQVAARQRVEVIKANQAAARAHVGVAHQGRAAAQAQTQAARKHVEAAQAAVVRAETTVQECRLTAPRAAVVEARNFEPGEVVLPGTHLLSLVHLAEVRAVFYLPNAELAAASARRPVTVVADAFPEQSFRGNIRHVSAQAEFTPKNVQTREDRDRLVYAVEVTVSNPDRKLRPGMPVEVAIDGTGQ